MSEIDRDELEVLRELVTEADLEQGERAVLVELLESAELGDNAAFEALIEWADVKGYHPPPGLDPAIPPRELMACPVPPDPKHYQRYRSRAAEVLTCPIHKVPLIPADQVKP